MASNLDLRLFFALHELPSGAGVVEGVVHWGKVRGLMADPERGRDRVRRGGVDVDRHPRRQRVIGAPVVPGEAAWRFKGAFESIDRLPRLVLPLLGRPCARATESLSH